MLAFSQKRKKIKYKDFNSENKLWLRDYNSNAMWNFLWTRRHLNHKWEVSILK